MPIKQSDRMEVRRALHAINNSLHVLGLQTELARLHIDNGNLNDARAALEQALQARTDCGEISGRLQRIIKSI